MDDLGRSDEAEAELREAIVAFDQRGDVAAEAETMVELATAIWHRGDTAQAWPLLHRAIELLERLPPGRELALARSRLAGAYVMAGDGEHGMPAVDKALALVEELGLDEFVGRLYQFRGIFRCGRGDLGGMDDLREGLRRVEELGIGRSAVSGYNNLGDWVWFAQGPAAGIEVYRAGIEFGRRRGLSGHVGWTMAQTLWTLFDLGSWEELLRTADEIGAIDQASGSGQVSVMAHTYRARVLIERGRTQEAVDLVPAFLPRAREIADPQVLAPALATSAVVELRAGSPEGARALVEEFERLELGSVYRSFLLTDVLRVAASGGDPDTVERLATRAAHPAARFRHASDTAKAMLAELRGDASTAAAAYAEVAERRVEYGHVLERGHALLGAGRCLLELGRPGEVGERLREARAVFDGLGAVTLVGETDDLLGRATAITS